MSLTIDICCDDAPGGPSVWIQRFAPQLRDLGFTVRIKLLTWEYPSSGVLEKTLVQNGFEFAVAKFEDTCTNVRWLLSTMQKRPPDVFIASHILPAYYVAKYLKRSGIPTIGVLRSDHSYYNALVDRFVAGHPSDRISGLVCVSEFLQQRIIGSLPKNIELRRISSGTILPLETAMKFAGTLRIAYVGRLVEESKKVSDLTRALVRATSEIQGVEATLFGDGSARPEVERILKGQSVNRVKLAGQLTSEEILEQLPNFHIIVLLSDYEGLPIALMEGMACGCVPVCLRIRSGIPELVEDGVTGLLVDDRGDSFVNAIRRLRNDPNLWQRLSSAACIKIETDYSMQTCAKKWEELIRLLHSRSGPKRPIEIPRRISLPPVHPGLAREDRRRCDPPLAVRLYRRSRKAAGHWRRRIIGQPLSRK